MSGPAIRYDVNTALAKVPVNVMPLTNRTDFKTIESAVAYDAAGLSLTYHFVTATGEYTATAVVPTSGGVHDWAHQGQGMYTIEIPRTGGTINNNAVGFGWFTGESDDVLPFTSRTFVFQSADSFTEADLSAIAEYLVTVLLANIPVLSHSRPKSQTMMIRATQNRGYTKIFTLLNSSGGVVVPGSSDRIRCVIGREAELGADLSGAKLTILSGSNTANGSSFTKNTPSSGKQELRLDAQDLTFAPGAYTLFIDYFDSSDDEEWKNVQKHVFYLEPTE